MRFDIQVLKAMLRLARRRAEADDAALEARVPGTRADVRTTVRYLERVGLVERRSERGARHTMEGFTVAVALPSAGARGKRPASRPALKTRAA